MKTYAVRVLIGFDQFVNTLLGGHPNETISARAWRRGSIESHPKWDGFRRVIDAVASPFELNHCEDSYIHFMRPTKTCGVYFPLHAEAAPSVVIQNSQFLPIDLPPNIDDL